ncbi:MAG: hypothetical protein AUJ56_03225 [Zetaproteobacteria bacterium CG1_02_49_23]|nr:MAG: hypothetical protein AUJ56_03225 [Zetaproteobacteria bacterium CG1_02_49_23]
MKYISIFAVLAGAFCIALPAQAELFDWVKAPEGFSKQHKEVLTDSAQLVTLEPDSSEMYPKVSKDGVDLLVMVEQKRSAWLSRRATENGDPLNVVTEDAEALTSFHWFDKDVAFLSNRAGSLGLWNKPANGEGLMHRSHELSGPLMDVTLLSDGTAIGVRLVAEAVVSKAVARQQHVDEFENWHVPGYNTYLVRIHADGSEERLSSGINPAVSPDEKQIVFSMPVGRSLHLFLMNVDGSGLAQLTDARSVDVQPAWSTDGQSIVFASNRAEADLRSGNKSQWDIWKISSQGMGLAQVTFDEARDGAPSMDSKGFVYFHSDRSISKEQKAERQIKSSVGKFHIWKIHAE